MAIVTIAHETGSGGPEIGIELAKRLGWRFVDREMLPEAALRYGVGEEKLTELDEKKPSLFERFDVETRRFITVLQSAILDAAEHDNVVINSRGGQILLRGISHALRVFVIAPFELRVKRVMKKMAGQAQEGVDVRTTVEMVRHSDREKRGRRSSRWTRASRCLRGSSEPW
jgi:cytidylate kinase